MDTTSIIKILEVLVTLEKKLTRKIDNQETDDLTQGRTEYREVQRRKLAEAIKETFSGGKERKEERADDKLSLAFLD